jgi:hypothetical protein
LGSASLTSFATIIDGAKGNLNLTLGSATLAAIATLAEGLKGNLNKNLEDSSLASTASFAPGLTAQINKALEDANLISDGFRFGDNFIGERDLVIFALNTKSSLNFDSHINTSPEFSLQIKSRFEDILSINK